MKILFLSNYFSPHIGGVEKHLRKVSETLIDQGYEVTIVTRRYKKSLKTREKVGKIKVLRFSHNSTKLLGLISIWIWLLKNRVIVKDSDIVHAHDVGIWYWPFRILYPQKPFFITFHGYEGYPVLMKSKLIRKINEKIAKGNICIGAFMEKWYGTKPTLISYGAVDTKKYSGDNKKDYKYDALFASRLDEQTGILTYVKAIKKLPNFNLLVLGDGKYKKEAQKVAIVKGFVRNTAPYLRRARYAFVSRYLAILEAFSSKKLVFAVYDNDIKKDYLMMTPFKKWMVIEKDPEKIAEKVEYYESNPIKANLIVDRAYDWVKDKTWERMVKNYLSLWEG